MKLRCALGMHRWSRGNCLACGQERRCTVTVHFWKDGKCEICGSRYLGPAQIATLIHKIHHKRLDSSLGRWNAELVATGPVAIPQIVNELLEIAQAYDELPNPPYLDLRNVLERIGPAGLTILKESVAAVAAEPVGRANAKPGQRAWITDVANEIIRNWGEEYVNEGGGAAQG
jgi:hypothetical protein